MGITLSGSRTNSHRPTLLYEHRVLYEVRKGRDAEVNGAVIGKDMKDVRNVIRRKITKMWQTRWKVSTKGRVTFLLQ